MRQLLSLTAAVAGLATPALAADNASADPHRFDVTSPVYQAPGADVPTLTRRAQACIPQFVHGVTVNAPVIAAADIEGGTVVANNAFAFKGVLGSPMDARSTLTFEAKPERFRITHSNIQMFINSWRDADGRHQKPALDALDDQIAGCITKSSTSDRSW